MRKHITLAYLYMSYGLALFAALPAKAQSPVGRWDFSGDLSASIGKPLTYFDGPGGDTEAATLFGKTSGLAIPSVIPTDAAGNPTGPAMDADIMRFPACNQRMGYGMLHGVAPNGGGSYVNQYTLVMDINYPAASSGQWRALLQTNPTNANDADVFVNFNNQLGIAGSYDGHIGPDTWYRIALVFDLPSNNLGKYINGQMVGSQTLTAGVDSRWALDPVALLFTDNDGETATGYVDQVWFYDSALSSTAVAGLGGLANGPILPEPGALGVLAIGGIALLRRRQIR